MINFDRLMKSNWRKVCDNRNNWLLALVLLLLAFAMRDLLADVFNKVWINPVMSKMYEDALWYFLFTSLVLTVYYGISYRQERYVSKPRLLLIIGTFMLYLLSLLYSTQEGQGWNYKSMIGEDKWIVTYYTSLVYMIPFIGELLLYAKRRKCRLKADSDCSFLYESPIKDKKEDSYKRVNYGKIIAQKINSNFHRDGSFVIGIAGNWGAGKTSFLNLIKDEIDRGSVDIIINFKPWLSSSPVNIISDFFLQLSKELSVYIPQSRNKLKDYVEAVSELNLDPLVKNLLKALKWELSNSAGNMYDDISRMLENSKLRILIFIDDIDRLSKDEIFEVFRLVRNTANFPYLQFIMPYDREYVLNTMNIFNAEKYIQKIFNLEISLPTFEVEIIRETLNRNLNHYLTIDTPDKDRIEQFLLNYEDDFPVERLIRTKRDVIRFTNSFVLNIDAITDSLDSRKLQDINILDLFKIELLRYVYPKYYDRLVQDPLSELELLNEAYTYKKNDVEAKLDDVHSLSEVEGLDDLSFPGDERNGKYIKQEELLSACMDNLFPLTPAENKNSISKIRAFDQYFRYRYDEKNISTTEIIQILLESDPIKQRQAIEEYYEEKKKREVFHMITTIVSKFNHESWRQDEQSPFYYKTVLRFLFSVFDSKNEKLIYEVADACSPIFNQSIYGDIDYYLEILQLWERILVFDILKEEKIIAGFIFKDNLQAKLRREVTGEDSRKIENFLRASESLVQMSELLANYVDPDNDLSSKLVLEPSQIKEIQLFYFMKYAERKKVDKKSADLFFICAEIEAGSRKILWNEEASKKMKELVDVDPQGYLLLFVIIDQIHICPPLYWKPIFNENPEEMEKYLFTEEKDQLKGIDEARAVWKLYKYNGYTEIPVHYYNKKWSKDAIIPQLGVSLDKMLDVKEQLDKLRTETTDNNPESNQNKKSDLFQLKEALDSIPLYIKLNGDLSREIDQELSKLI